MLSEDRGAQNPLGFHELREWGPETLETLETILEAIGMEAVDQ